MSSTSKLVREFLAANSPSSAEMTARLKVIGDGDMNSGIIRLINYVDDSTAAKILTVGACGGVAITLLASKVKKLIVKYKKNRAEGEDILKGLTKEMSKEEIEALAEDDDGKLHIASCEIPEATITV